MFDEGNLKLKMAKHFLGRRKKRKSDENDSSCYTLLLLYVRKLCVCTNGLLLVNSKCFLAGIICSVKFFMEMIAMQEMCGHLNLSLEHQISFRLYVVF